MKLSDYKDEDALDLLADIIDPATEIIADDEIRKAVRTESKLAVIKIILKNHKRAVMEILAAMDGVPVEDYHVKVWTLPTKLLEIMNDKELMDFFTSAELTEEQTISTESAENTEAPGK